MNKPDNTRKWVRVPVSELTKSRLKTLKTGKRTYDDVVQELISCWQTRGY